MTTVLESLNAGLHRAMTVDERVYLLGEDILDPYGGAFKVTRGLSTEFPGRVITTPISEAGIVGVGAGMALRGLLPVVEIMFGDFVTLIADQVINHLSKFRWMYNEQVRVPLVIRTPMGGRRGYGPTHSQTLEKLFLGVPGLITISPNVYSDPGELLSKAILDIQDPVLFVENKLLYLQRLFDPSEERDLTIETSPQPIVPGSTTTFPFHRLSVRGAPPAVLTVMAYGYMAEVACKAALELAFTHEIFVEILVPAVLAPFDAGPFVDTVRGTGRLLVVEEGTLTLGWGAEVVARTKERLGEKLLAARRVAARDLPIPASGSLESAVLPGVQEVVKTALEMV